MLKDWFETKTRGGETGDGTSYVTLKSDAPEWLRSAVYAAHSGGGVLPNDWIYGECRAVCERLDEGTDLDGDWIHEHANARVDVYTADRFAWASEFALTPIFDAAEERAMEIWGEGERIEARLGVIQYCAIVAIAEAIGSALEAYRAECTELPS